MGYVQHVYLLLFIYWANGFNLLFNFYVQFGQAPQRPIRVDERVFGKSFSLVVEADRRHRIIYGRHHIPTLA